MPRTVLFISNGHGEDSNSGFLIRSLQPLAPDIACLAQPMVGLGHAYRRLVVPIIGPTQELPSGGFTYVNRWLLLRNIQAGLLGLTLGQLQAVRRVASQVDLVFATGDTVSQSLAYLSGRPFLSFISPFSALYEGRLRLDFILRAIVRSPRCLALITRDAFTAEDLTRQGFQKVVFGGIPSLDGLIPTGKDLALDPYKPMVALFPGSRLPEAVRNFKVEMGFVQAAVALMGERVQFRAALVPALKREVPSIAQEMGWEYSAGRLTSTLPDGQIAEIRCYDDAFADIIQATTLVIGMAGLAVEQAVALGKPVILIPGEGPQFTYPFAEAQERLLGLNAQTIGTGPATGQTLQAAASALQKTLDNPAYLEACREQGIRRLGSPGAAERLARLILAHLPPAGRPNPEEP